MRIALTALTALSLVSLGCTSRTGTTTLTVQRKGALTFTVENGATPYDITLDSGQLAIADINLVDDAATIQTPLLDAPTLFDFVAQDSLLIGPVEVRPKGFEQLHVFIEDAVDGPLVGRSLRLSGQVTLSNAQVVPLTVELTMPRSSQEMLAAISIHVRRSNDLKTSFDPTILLGKIDFDTLGAAGDITLTPNSGDPAIDAALNTIIDNLLRSFTFDGPIGGDITG